MPPVWLLACMQVARHSIDVTYRQVRHTAGHGSWSARLKALLHMLEAPTVALPELRVGMEIFLASRCFFEGTEWPPRVAGPNGGIFAACMTLCLRACICKSSCSRSENGQADELRTMFRRISNELGAQCGHAASRCEFRLLRLLSTPVLCAERCNDMKRELLGAAP